MLNLLPKSISGFQKFQSILKQNENVLKSRFRIFLPSDFWQFQK